MVGSVDSRHQNLQRSWVKDMNNIEVNSGIRNIPASQKKHSGYVVRSKYPWPPKSTSTDSTTSLAQLHDKLRALPSVTYNKTLPPKISITPNLPTVREVSEHDDLSNILSKRKLFGVARYYTSENKATSLAENRFLASQSANQGYQSENENTIPLIKRSLRAYQSDAETETDVKKTKCISPLFQFHDKLRASLICNKIPPKISITPESPKVSEVSEHDDHSNILSKRKPFGVARHYTSENKASRQSANENTIPLVERRLRAYQSDTETKKIVKKTRCISPVNKENSHGLLFMAAQSTTDESVINDTFDKNDKLCKDEPEYNLIDLLVKEALQNDQEKDSGVSTKRTQESDVIENTPIENIVHRKKSKVNRVKHTVISNSTTDESNTDVIDDTPCYVYDRKKRVKTDTKKNDNTFDVAIVDTFFSQHMYQNNEGIYISPTLAKRINETSSEASHDNDDKAIFREEVEAVIVDFLNIILDKVCSDLDKDTDLMNEKQQHIDTLCKVQHFDESSVTSDISHTKNNISMEDIEKHTDDTKKNAVKFKLSKNRGPKLKKKQQNPKNIKQPNKVNEDNVVIEKANENSPAKNLTLKMNKKQQNPKNIKKNKVNEGSVRIEQNLNANSPENMTKAMCTRKKRKLYSPKDGDNDNHEIPRVKTESRQSNINKTPMATCYKELEKARKSRIRLPRKSRVSTEPLTSPKTKTLNDLFDKIKEHVDNEEKITLADKSKLRNKKKLPLYNLSSESDDQDFQEKKIKAQNRVSTSSLESSAKKRSRVVKLPNYYSEFDYRALCGSEDEDRGTKKPKIVKQSKPRSRKVKKEQNITLIDERMRQAQPEVLETSFIKETVTTNPEVVEPAIQQVPVLESIPDDINDIVTDTIMLENRVQTLNKSDIVKIKKEKGITQKNEKPVVTKRGKVPNKQEINKHVPKERDSATVSPLPGLVVETEKLHKDDISSSIEANLLQKFKKIYVQNQSTTDATQNLLLNANIYNDADVGLNEHIETVVVTDDSSERSIATVGHSPITGHNDLNESPPNVDLLHERFQHRDVDNEGISRDLAEFLNNMRNQMNCKSDTFPVNTSPVLPLSRMSSKRSVKKHSTASAKSSATNPVVVLKRLSTEEIETNHKPVVTPSLRSQISSSKVLSKVSPKEIGKYRSPKTSSSITPPRVVLDRLSFDDINKCLRSQISSSTVLSKVSSEEIGKYRSPKTSSSIRSPQVVLDRLSFDDINKWLPIPQLKSKEANNNVPKEYKKKQTPKLVGVAKITPDKVKEKKFKSMISPVKLNLGSFEKTDFCASHATKVNKNQDEAIILLSQKPSTTKTTEKYGNENYIKNTHKSVETSNTTDTLRKDKTRCAIESDDKIANSPENIARVQDWFKRNVSTSTSGKADNVAVKEIFSKVIETLDTTLAEIHQSSREKLIHNYLENQKSFEAFKQEVYRKLEEIDKMSRERVYQVLREDEEEKALMVRLLKEDIQAAMDLFEKTDK